MLKFTIINQKLTKFSYSTSINSRSYALFYPPYVKLTEEILVNKTKTQLIIKYISCNFKN